MASMLLCGCRPLDASFGAYHALVKEAVWPLHEAILKQSGLSLPLVKRGDVQMTALIITVVGAGALAAVLFTTNLAAEVALAVLAVL